MKSLISIFLYVALINIADLFEDDSEYTHLQLPLIEGSQ